ncbi:MAG: cupin domain-containing protein [Oscillospiraceae bacterium]|nr:cupin domain-containing protein [Oscillospiraceae bacterium]
MVYNKDNSHLRQVDSFLEITDLFVNAGQPIDVVLGNLNGFHGSFVNTSSDKYYYILEGEAVVKIQKKAFNVGKGDFIHIPIMNEHSIEGNVKLLIICSPPYDPTSEITVDNQAE